MNPILIGADLVAIALLVFATYLPRHRRRDLMVSFLVVNVGVLAVSEALSSSVVGAGLGLGLFGVLSIIRLRSEELSHRDIAYYFAALALGLIAGLGVDLVLSLGLMGMIVVVLFVGDHPRIARTTVTSQLVLDGVYADEDDLRSRAAELVPGKIIEVSVTKLDLVNDLTWVNVRSVQVRSAAMAAERSAHNLRAVSREPRGESRGEAAVSGDLADPSTAVAADRGTELVTR